MPADDILLDCEEQMDKTVEHLRHELRGVRTGRASPALVENIKVDYYGSQTDLRAISAISRSLMRSWTMTREPAWQVSPAL